MGKVYVGQPRTQIRLRPYQDLAAVIGVRIRAFRPDGVAEVWAAAKDTAGADHRVVKTSDATTWMMAGDWIYQSELEVAVDEWVPGEAVRHRIYALGQ